METARAREWACGPDDEPTIDVLLDVDAEYRRKVSAHQLPTMSPRCFNGARRAPIPILHTARGDWRFTVRYSYTPLAHQLRRTHDWVVIYFHRAHEPERRRTVVTETRGPLEGRRVVRGRETEPVVRAA
jgi:hypothetical protein